MDRMLGRFTSHDERRRSSTHAESSRTYLLSPEDDDLPSGMITPLDPHNLMLAIDEDSSVLPRRLTRKLIANLGQQFPIGKDGEEPRSEESVTDTGFEDPLPSIANIAKRGWELPEDQAGSSRKSRRPVSLSDIPLPAEDAALLAYWSSNQLQDIIKEQTGYFEHGLHMSKRDVAEGLNPIQQGLISETRALELFEA